MSCVYCLHCDNLVDTDFKDGLWLNNGFICDNCINGLEELTEEMERVPMVKQICDLARWFLAGCAVGLVYLLLTGCSVTMDVYSPFTKTGLAERQLHHDKMPLSFQDRLDMRDAYKADKGSGK